MLDQTFVITFDLYYLGWCGGRSSHRGRRDTESRLPLVVLIVPAVAWAAHGRCQCQGVRAPIYVIPEWGMGNRMGAGVMGSEAGTILVQMRTISPRLEGIPIETI